MISQVIIIPSQGCSQTVPGAPGKVCLDGQRSWLRGKGSEGRHARRGDRHEQGLRGGNMDHGFLGSLLGFLLLIPKASDSTLGPPLCG